MDQSVQQESRIILQILPAEIWNLVFETIQDTQDLISCANASPVFHKLLEPQKAFYLLPQVLRVLDKLKYFDDHQAPEDIFCFRLVCHKWKFAVDSFLEMRPYHFTLRRNRDSSFPPNENRDDIAYHTYFRPYAFTVDELESKLLPELSETLYETNNPFPSRHLEIVEGDAQINKFPRSFYMEMYRGLIAHILEKVGYHIWHAMIYIRDKKERWFTHLVNYVSLMPNLKTLYIFCPESFSESRHGKQLLFPEEMSFPSLEHLEILSTENVPGLAVNRILAVGHPSLKGLEIFRKYPDDFDVTGICPVEKLSASLMNVEELARLPENPSIKILHLKFSFSVKTAWTLPEIWEKLDKYGDSLLELILDTPMTSALPMNNQMQTETKVKPLRLPKLKALDINLSCRWSLDFLLGLTELEILHLRLDHTDRNLLGQEHIGFGSEKINFYHGYSTRVMQCNIWELMPKLKEFSFVVGLHPRTRTQKFTREHALR